MVTVLNQQQEAGPLLRAQQPACDTCVHEVPEAAELGHLISGHVATKPNRLSWSLETILPRLACVSFSFR